MKIDTHFHDLTNLDSVSLTKIAPTLWCKYCRDSNLNIKIKYHMQNDVDTFAYLKYPDIVGLTLPLSKRND